MCGITADLTGTIDSLCTRRYGKVELTSTYGNQESTRSSKRKISVPTVRLDIITGTQKYGSAKDTRIPDTKKRNQVIGSQKYLLTKMGSFEILS